MVLMYNPLIMRGRTPKDVKAINDSIKKFKLLTINKYLRICEKESSKYIADGELFANDYESLKLLELTIQKLMF